MTPDNTPIDPSWIATMRQARDEAIYRAHCRRNSHGNDDEAQCYAVQARAYDEQVRRWENEI